MFKRCSASWILPNHGQTVNTLVGTVHITRSWIFLLKGKSGD